MGWMSGLTVLSPSFTLSLVQFLFQNEGRAEKLSSNSWRINSIAICLYWKPLRNINLIKGSHCVSWALTVDLDCWKVEQAPHSSLVITNRAGYLETQYLLFSYQQLILNHSVSVTLHKQSEIMNPQWSSPSGLSYFIIIEMRFVCFFKPLEFILKFWCFITVSDISRNRNLEIPRNSVNTWLEL